MKKMQLWASVAALAATMACAQANAAAGLIYTTGNIADPPGVYMGTGNVNGDYSGVVENNIELALRAKDRGTLATIAPDGGGVYHVPSGFCNPVCTGSLKAAWNYELSVNLRADGGTLDLTQVFFELLVDIDPTVGTSFATISNLLNWGDNDYWSSGGERHDAGIGPQTGEYGVQQSINPMFPNSGFGFLPSDGLYDIKMSIWQDNDGRRMDLASTMSQFQVGEKIPVIPEPASLALLLMAIGTLIWQRHKPTTGRSMLVAT